MSSLTVVQLDDEAAKRWGIAVSDRVVSKQIVPCWKCRYCLRGGTGCAAAYAWGDGGLVAGARAKSPAHVVALDLAPQKLELAKECGADVVINIGNEDAIAIVNDLTDGYGADVYLEGTGHPSAVVQGLNILRKRGTYVE